MENETLKLLRSGKWYVVDPFHNGFGGKGEIVSGPFDTWEAAEQDRLEWNCADDYIIRRAE